MILSIDIGGTYIKYGIVNSDGILSHFDKMKTPKKSYEELIERLTSLYFTFNNYDLLGIAISVPGSIDHNGKSTGISALGYILNKNIKDDLYKRVSKKITIENDANCTVLSEKWNNNVNNIAAISIGTGIGGSFIMNGELIRGSSNSAGEFGLMFNLDNNLNIDIVPLSTVQMVNKHNNKHNLKMTAEEIVYESKNGSKICLESMDDFYRRLCILVINIEFFINPEEIIFSGGITNEITFMENFTKHYNTIKEHQIFDVFTKYKVSEYKASANLIGAAYIWYK